MSTDLSVLIVEQTNTIASMKRVLINFKKLAKANITLPKTKGRLSDLKELWEKVQSLNNRICCMAAADERKDNPYFVNKEFYDAEGVYIETADYINESISKLSTTDSATNQSSIDSSFHDTQGHATFQLPRISLPKFSGEYSEWETFRNTFESIVENNDALSKTQKFHYLRSSLIGDAAKLIENLKISDANYDSARQILTDEFDDKQALVHANIHSFMSLPSMKSENAKDLKKLRDTLAASLAALKNLERPVEKWDDILIYIVSQKFSSRTRNEWNLKRSALSPALPSYQNLYDFLTLRIRGLTDLSDTYNNSSNSRDNKPRSSVNNVFVLKCVNCSGNHHLSKCENFLAKSAVLRSAIVRQNKLCFNCIRFGHFTPKCKSKGRCTHCGRAHHSLLHSANSETLPDKLLQTSTTAVGTTSNSNTAAANTTAVANVQTVQTRLDTSPTVLLATAWVTLHTAEGRTFKVRALLDQGSTYSFISESLCQTMRTKRQHAGLQICCFGEKYAGKAKSRISVALSPCSKFSPTFPLTAYVYQRITSYAASQSRTVDSWSHLRDLPLADPDPTSNHPIHLLIGTDLYGSLLLNDLCQGPRGTPTAQSTALGWILSGLTSMVKRTNECASVSHIASDADTNSLLQAFWEDENIFQPLPLTDEERKCEEHFTTTHSRSSEGRYIVRLPFKQGPPIAIGESLAIALSLYNRTERRLQRRPEIHIQYREFLHEYQSLGHMQPVEDASTALQPVYIPHHAVLRESSSTTKLRVVFNASCKTSSGTSLNDFLLIGPKLQADLSAIILRWRQWRYVYTADITKMFRQILVDSRDVDFQRILWRPDEDSEIKHFRLLTVTYGLASAPYLAIRVLKQLAVDDGLAFPKAVAIIENALYVDDTLFGDDDLDGLRDARNQLIELMKRGGFQLRKWASNLPELLADIPYDQCETVDHFLVKDETMKVLGLSWFRVDTDAHETLYFIVHIKTVRSSRVGSSCRDCRKNSLQELWLRKGDWDDPLPSDLSERWHSYHTDLKHLEAIKISRWTGRNKENLGVELHGFADASNRAYAAVVYLRVIHSFESFQISLLAAKTKVAPLKTLSIPRLELNAVVLLGRLLKWTIESLNLAQVPIYGWTDSTITLAWLRQHPSKWSTYVANRISEVQTSLPKIRWNHVSSKHNPADCASRGISASELVSHALWWSGPPWLRQSSTSWPIHDPLPPFDTLQTEQLSVETRKATILHVERSQEWELPYELSSWTRLVRVTAYLRRFIANLKRKKSLQALERMTLAVGELRDAANFWFKYVQSLFFSDEVRELTKSLSLSSSSSLRTLHAFLGDDHLLRLGGRLKNAAMSYSEQHPIILPKHRISELLIANAHKVTLHGGAQLTLRILRQRYWILGARNLVKKHIKLCVTCTRHAALVPTQLMGDLPAPRVTPSSPFSNTGVDYAGPFNVTAYVGRGQKATKNYVALFVCLSTKAIHLECVDDYSTNGFLSAFQRFASRRGLPSHMYSDNGTNFQGADHELQRNFAALRADAALHEMLANDHVQWHFIPAAASHFGGLWEAGVKSFKHHFRRIVGPRTLSKSEFVTLLCKIEACLNSRPIAALSDDPTDLSSLTPGHFLVGRPIVSVPEESVLEIDPNRLSRWQLVRSMQEQIWRSWTKDYLYSLQNRFKWFKREPDIKLNELVLVRNHLTPPSKWELARVKETHPGTDGHVRVVTLQTAKTTYKRPITQICRLPIESDTELPKNILSN